MKSFKTYLKEGGQAAGKMELVSTDVDRAKAFAEKLFTDLNKDIPDFENNYKMAQKAASYGKTKRKDMPVIEDRDVKILQRHLERGYIDHSKPFAPNTNEKNPFPEGLSGKEARHWMQNGLKAFDGNKTDDNIKVTMEKEKIRNLKPIQKQIYYDISISASAQFGVEKTKAFLGSSFFIISSDNRILDGHHRFLSGMLVAPDMIVNVLKIDMPLSKLLPLTIAFGDAIGNKRNQ